MLKQSFIYFTFRTVCTVHLFTSELSITVQKLGSTENTSEELMHCVLSWNGMLTEANANICNFKNTFNLIYLDIPKECFPFQYELQHLKKKVFFIVYLPISKTFKSKSKTYVVTKVLKNKNLKLILLNCTHAILKLFCTQILIYIGAY